MRQEQAIPPDAVLDKAQSTSAVVMIRTPLCQLVQLGAAGLGEVGLDFSQERRLRPALKLGVFPIRYTH